MPLALSGGAGQGAIQAAPAAAGRGSATPSAQCHPATIVVPDVLGLNLKEAETVILSVTTHRHITVVRIKAAQTAGVVVREAPAPGTRVAADSQITLTVPRAS